MLLCVLYVFLTVGWCCVLDFLFLLFVSPFSLCPSASVVAKNSFLVLNEKEISSSLFKRRDLVSFCFFVGNVSFIPTNYRYYLSRTSSCLLSLPNLLASKSSPRRMRRRNRSTKLFRWVLRFSRVNSLSSSFARRMTTLSDEFSFFLLPFSRWIISPMDDECARWDDFSMSSPY